MCVCVGVMSGESHLHPHYSLHAISPSASVTLLCSLSSFRSYFSHIFRHSFSISLSLIFSPSSSSLQFFPSSLLPFFPSSLLPFPLPPSCLRLSVSLTTLLFTIQTLSLFYSPSVFSWSFQLRLYRFHFGDESCHIRSLFILHSESCHILNHVAYVVNHTQHDTFLAIGQYAALF